MNKNVRIAKQLIKIAKSLIAGEEDFITDVFPKAMKALGFKESGNKFSQNFQLDQHRDIEVSISVPQEKNDKFTCELSEDDTDSVEIQFTTDTFANELENGMKQLEGFGKIYKSIDYNKIK